MTFELIRPTPEIVRQFNTLWFGEDSDKNWNVTLFAGEAEMNLRELIPAEEFKRWKDGDEAIQKRLNKENFPEALRRINATYHTRVNTDEISSHLSWAQLFGGDVDSFVRLCKTETKKSAYSFATKVYSFLCPDRFPILDAISVTLLDHYLRAKESPEDKTPAKSEWGDYSQYKAAYDAFKEKYGLTALSYKKIDVFLWTYGIALQRYWARMGVLNYESVSYKKRPIPEENRRRIDQRLEAGLALLRETYRVEACPSDPALTDPVIGGRPHHARRYDIAGVGNLLVMTVKEAEENQLSSFVLMPYAKNLPLFSTDFVYSGEKRFFLLEIYDLSVEHDENFDAGIEAFRAFGETLTDLPDFPTRAAWYDDIRPVCWAKTYGPAQDGFALDRFLAFLRLFVAMEQAASSLSGDALAEKWEKNRAYADRLIDEGGVSTDLFTEALGAENTRRFFHEVFFGAAWYKPKLELFFAHRDADGVTNREKIAQNQRVIRRVAATDQSKSYEDSDSTADGVVLRDGKLIGFGIHIFNEDIYPLQSFEIYYRGCGLGGALDLSGCTDLLFVDLYHNEIEAVDVSGCEALRILGLQDNAIARLDVGDLKACQGIDAGKNRLTALDVSQNGELAELYVNDNELSEIDLSRNPKLKYFYCHNNRIPALDTTANPLLRHLDATGNPMKEIRSLAPRREEPLPLTLTAEGDGTVGLKFCPVYNAQWKETGQWRQTYFAVPAPGAAFAGWFDAAGTLCSADPVWEDEYGSSRVLTARFV